MKQNEKPSDLALPFHAWPSAWEELRRAVFYDALGQWADLKPSYKYALLNAVGVVLLFAQRTGREPEIDRAEFYYALVKYLKERETAMNLSSLSVSRSKRAFSSSKS